MLLKKYRLPTSFFRAHQRPVQSFICGGISIRMYPTHFSYPRCAVIVPLRTAQGAVDRNAIRRTIYDILRVQITEIPAYDIVFFIAHAEHVSDDAYTAVKKIIHTT